VAKGGRFCGLDETVVGFLPFPSYAEFCLSCKHKALKLDLKKWNKVVFGNVERKKRNLLDNYGFLMSLKKEGP
jgi:hypothetical protein